VEEVFSFAKTVAALVIMAVMLNGTVIPGVKIPSESRSQRSWWAIIFASKLSYGIRLHFLTRASISFQLLAVAMS
jgi:hypothetical protein